MKIDFTGIWRADLLKSKLLGPIPRAITITIAHSDPELHQGIVVEKVDGSEERAIFECLTNGKRGRMLLNGKPVDGTASWQRNELAIRLRLASGARDITLHDYWSLSPDGNTLTMEHRDDALAGQVTILEKSR
jgi:hypothetical protein